MTHHLLLTKLVIGTWSGHTNGKTGQKKQEQNVEKQEDHEERERYPPPLVLDVARDEWMLKQLEPFLIYLYKYSTFNYLLVF